jgi:EAL domain-containing protein (putative c-di-GMP-specific phosphodiesterase class I)
LSATSFTWLADLDLVSIAEGVESPEVWARLAELGCREIQGYVLTPPPPPLPPAALDAWLDDWRLSQENYAATAS